VLATRSLAATRRARVMAYRVSSGSTNKVSCAKRAPGSPPGKESPKLADSYSGTPYFNPAFPLDRAKGPHGSRVAQPPAKNSAAFSVSSRQASKMIDRTPLRPRSITSRFAIAAEPRWKPSSSSYADRRASQPSATSPAHFLPANSPTR
jgi:hypothetical protein